MNFLSRLLLLCISIVLVTSNSFAQQTSGDCVIATREAPPFSFKMGDGNWTGLSHDLWLRISQELQLDCTLQETSLEEMLDGVQDGKFTAAVAALTITEDRERTMDFTHPFYLSGIGIATTQRQQNYLQMLFSLISLPLLQVIGALILVLLLSGLLVWFFERKHNPEQFANKGWKGIFDGFYWSATTMTTVGYGDKAPSSFPGRLLALVWMFAGVMIISSFTAGISSALTTIQLTSSIRDASDLIRLEVGTVDDSTSERWLMRFGVRNRRSFADVETAMRALVAEDIDAVVYDAPVMSYLSQQDWAEDVVVLPQRVNQEEYGIALPQGSEHRENMNRSILRVTRSDEWAEVLAKYVD
jgi:ABC-type amino acid transport substrate-binding protein